MTPERFREIEALFQSAREQGAEILAGADPELRSVVESLLAQESGRKVSNPAAELTVNPTMTMVTVGSQLGPYRIDAVLGEGGMGRVYRALDTRLARNVAIKISHENFTERFEREARTIAALNHPFICTLYDVGPNYLVMELVEGETMATRLKKGKLSLDDTLRYGAQVADALAAAHGRGITHRDLKPANVMLAKSGVKVLDFGLAKSSRDESLTATNVAMGTPAYMAPEQFEAKDADSRTDIYALGLLLFEMATGKRVPQGERPSFSALPERLAHVVERCLEPNPEDRWQTSRDVKAELEWAAKPDSGVENSARAKSPPYKAPWILSAALLLALGALAFVLSRERPAERPVLQYTVAPPEKARNVSSFAISPDGRYLAIAASGDGEPQIWVRSLDSLQTQALAGTEGAAFPFWSPDSQSIAFFAKDKLKKIPVTGGTPQILCDVPSALGGAWSREGVIVFGGGGLSRVPEAGGVPVKITETEGTTHRWPVFLPDGKRLLYLTPRGAQSGIEVTSLDDPKQTRRLTPDITNPEYVAPQPGSAVGHLLFVRGGTLMAQPVDPKTMDNQGELFPVAQQVSRGTLFGTNLYSVSATGTLVYLNRGGAGATTQHVWLDRTGKELEKAGGPLRSRNTFALSPDGKRVVVEQIAGGEANSDLWLIDMEHGGTETRLTFDASISYYPVWSPDGSKVAFASNRNGGNFNLYQRASNGTGQDELLFESKDPAKFPWDWSHDGRFLLFRAQDAKTGSQLWALPVMGPGEKKPFAVRDSPFNETQVQLSPDGRCWPTLPTSRETTRCMWHRSRPRSTNRSPGSGRCQPREGRSLAGAATVRSFTMSRRTGS